jgi:hypothetical protein
MGERGHMNKTRSDVLIDALARNRKARAMSMETFAQRMVDAYTLQTNGHAGGIQFKLPASRDIKDIYAAAATNAKRITRWTDDGVIARIPVDAEEAWVAALDEPFRTECLSELAHRYGLLAVPCPLKNPNLGSDLEAISSMTKEVGDVLQAISPMMADGRIGPEDAGRAPGAIKQLEELQDAVAVLIANIKTHAGVA